MLTEQRESRQSMVDPGYFPVALVMAGLTFFPFLTLVLVILLVAGNTDCRQFVREQRSLVAAIAFGQRVFPKQGVFGVTIVVKRGGFPSLLTVA